MELEEQPQNNCILCLSKFSPKIDKGQINGELVNGTVCTSATTTTSAATTNQISGEGEEVTNFIDLCNFLRLFPVNEDNQRIPCLPCDTILCLRCLEKVEFLKGLYAQLKEIGRSIKVTTRALETVILENSGNCSKEDEEEVEVICAKVFGENVKTVIGGQLTIAENLEFKRKALELHEIFGEIEKEGKEEDNGNGPVINQTTDVTSTHSTEGITITETTSDKPKQFQCPVCAQSSDRVESFMEHIAKNHSGGVAGESQGDPLIKLSLGAQNEVTINGKTSYKCPQCDELFERVKYLRYHVNSNHVPESRRAPPKIKCPFLCCFGVRGDR